MFKLLKIIFINAIFLFIFSVCNLFSKTYTGTAYPLAVQTIASGSDSSYYGTIKYVAEKGEIITPKITDLQGKVVDPGTIIMQQGTKYWKAIVDSDKASVMTAIQDVRTATQNLQRYKELAPTGAESVEAFQNYQNDYYKYLGAFLSDKGTLSLDEEVLDTRTSYAPFEGYVSNILYPVGYAANNPKTIEITQLNPIGIKVKMPRNEAKKITPATPVTISIPGTETRQGVINGASMLTDDGIMFITENYPKQLPEKLTKNVKFYIKDCYPVEYLYLNPETNNTLCLPKSSIQKDSKGYFVWKASGRKFLSAGKPFNPIFQVKKTYFTPGKLMRLFSGRIYYQSIAQCKDLEFGDAVIYNPPKEIQDGDLAAIPLKRYIIMPNDTLKIEIGDQ